MHYSSRRQVAYFFFISNVSGNCSINFHPSFRSNLNGFLAGIVMSFGWSKILWDYFSLLLEEIFLFFFFFHESLLIIVNWKLHLKQKTRSKSVGVFHIKELYMEYPLTYTHFRRSGKYFVLFSAWDVIRWLILVNAFKIQKHIQRIHFFYSQKNISKCPWRKGSLWSHFRIVRWPFWFKAINQIIAEINYSKIRTEGKEMIKLYYIFIVFHRGNLILMPWN